MDKKGQEAWWHEAEGAGEMGEDTCGKDAECDDEEVSEEQPWQRCEVGGMEWEYQRYADG